ncbi:hypothetical protein VT84_37055 [Gemmata sp. SH-PL17]|uniref:hypothetical protein n=1 Tax=Gemmata sp. SH-PL17 TaxID=1630693 RepID=UPI00078CAECF|nr:hypothetical protein [Gemmata sp. SH-PL17]AMV30062.1 hypothetical protein VT84_37055 [Gemmata sp. SH-PL17]
MQVRLKKPHRGMPVGTVWVPPWESKALELIADGTAEPLDAAPGEPRVTVADVAPAVPEPAAAKPTKPKGEKKPKAATK